MPRKPMYTEGVLVSREATPTVFVESWPTFIPHADLRQFRRFF